MYIHRLNLALRSRGIDATGVYLAAQPRRGTVDGVPVIALEESSGNRSRMEEWACLPQGLEQFQALLRELRPDVVHFHSTLQIHAPEYFETARKLGACTLWTYHAPGQSCLQTSLLRNGDEPCDGRIDSHRCTQCCLIWLQLPRPLAPFFSKLDLSAFAPLVPARARHPFQRRAGTELFARRFAQALGFVDLWITHSRWCRTVLLENGVAQTKLYDLPLPPPPLDVIAPETMAWDGLPGNLRLLFAGRLLDKKGAHILLDALRGPLSGMDLALALLAPPCDNPYERAVRAQVAQEPRARLVSTMRSDSTLAAMAASHVVVVPSTWLETGPYTVVEALWTGARVVGSDIGGIPERIEAVPGSILFKAGSASDLAQMIRTSLPSLQDDSNRSARAAAYRSMYRDRFDAALNRLIEALATGACKSSAGITDRERRGRAVRMATYPNCV
jgi:glycosyltransferase involved in cell wall biosynthesis